MITNNNDTEAKSLANVSVHVVVPWLTSVFLFSVRLKEKLYNVLKAAGGGFWRDMEQATDDNQGCCDARLCGESHVEWSVLVSSADLLHIEIQTTAQVFQFEVSEQGLWTDRQEVTQLLSTVKQLPVA